MSPELVRNLWILKNSNISASYFETLTTRPANTRVGSASAYYLVFVKRYQPRLLTCSDIQFPAAVMRISVYKVTVGIGTFKELAHFSSNAFSESMKSLRILIIVRYRTKRWPYIFSKSGSWKRLSPPALFSIWGVLSFWRYLFIYLFLIVVCAEVLLKIKSGFRYTDNMHADCRKRNLGNNKIIFSHVFS